MFLLKVNKIILKILHYMKIKLKFEQKYIKNEILNIIFLLYRQKYLEKHFFSNYFIFYFQQNKIRELSV